MMDVEFERIKDEMTSFIINTTAAKEHVAEIEHQIRTAKDQPQSILNTLQYKQLLCLIIIELLHFIVMCIST